MVFSRVRGMMECWNKGLLGKSPKTEAFLDMMCGEIASDGELNSPKPKGEPIYEIAIS